MSSLVIITSIHRRQSCVTITNVLIIYVISALDDSFAINVDVLSKYRGRNEGWS